MITHCKRSKQLSARLLRRCDRKGCGQRRSHLNRSKLTEELHIAALSKT